MKQKLLLVDDRPENLFVLESTLENPRLEFVRAHSGEEALKHLLRNDISIILLDVQMPEMDGFETAELVHGNPKTKHIPIIFVSAINQEKKHIFKGYESGAIDYIFKPFDPEILKSKVDILLELDKQRRIVQNQNTELSFAKRNTDSILKNVNEGLFLLNREYKILPQYSQALEHIFNIENLANADFMSILKNSIADKLYKSFSEFIGLCFDSSIDPATIRNLNPISEVEFQPKSEDCVKHLSFEARRIYDDDIIENLIFTVNDNTPKVLLEKKVAEIEEESSKQMDNLLSILHVDPKLLKDFIESLEREITESKNIIDKLSSIDDKSDSLASIFRYMHAIKGNAAVLDLKNFMQKAHQAEDIIIKLQKMDNPSEKDIALLSQCLESMQTRIEEINQLISRLSHIYKYFRPKRTYEIELLFRAINNLVENLQHTTCKKVKLVYDNFDGVSIPYNCRLDLKDILVQLIRNSFYHGIESKEERKKLHKDAIGKITVETLKDNNSIGFTFKDDGRGIQLEKLKNAVQKSGKWEEKEIHQWDDNQLMQSIYGSGISTMTKVNTGAGRGVGMDIVKHMVEKSGGKIEIKSEINKYTLFKITFPPEHKKKGILKANKN